MKLQAAGLVALLQQPYSDRQMMNNALAQFEQYLRKNAGKSVYVVEPQCGVFAL